MKESYNERELKDYISNLSPNDLQRGLTVFLLPNGRFACLFIEEKNDE